MNIPGLLAAIGGLLLLWICLPYLLKRWQIVSLRRRCRESRVIVLSYDDGPGAVLTPVLLKLLASKQVHANFFMIGKNIEALPNLVSEVVAQGHVIGSHSYQHGHAWKTNPFAIKRDIQAGFAVCKPISSSSLFRPPYGKITLATLLQTWIAQQTLAWWTIDSTDTWARPLAVERTLERVRREGGGVILMHDSDRAEAGTHEYVINLTHRLIQLAHEEGYSIRTLQDVPTVQVLPAE